MDMRDVEEGVGGGVVSGGVVTSVGPILTTVEGRRRV